MIFLYKLNYNWNWKKKLWTGPFFGGNFPFKFYCVCNVDIWIFHFYENTLKTWKRIFSKSVLIHSLPTVYEELLLKNRIKIKMHLIIKVSLSRREWFSNFCWGGCRIFLAIYIYIFFLLFFLANWCLKVRWRIMSGLPARYLSGQWAGATAASPSTGASLNHAGPLNVWRRLSKLLLTTLTSLRYLISI